MIKKCHIISCQSPFKAFWKLSTTKKPLYPFHTEVFFNAEVKIDFPYNSLPCPVLWDKISKHYITSKYYLLHYEKKYVSRFCQ